VGSTGLVVRREIALYLTTGCIGFNQQAL